MSEGSLITLALVLCAWVAWLERRVRRLADERDTLCATLVDLAYGRLTITVGRDRSITVKPVER